MSEAIPDYQVAEVIREVAAAEVLPRFRALSKNDISEKSPGDFVTIADQECERVLSERLRLLRDLPVVGEEGTAADPTLLDLVGTAPAAWIIDPIDGTSNFVSGNPNFVVMVALLEHGETAAAWVWHAESQSMLTAQRGKGTRRNGQLVQRDLVADGIPRGIMKRRYVPEPARSRLADFSASVGENVPALGSAGIEYGALIDGHIDYLFYWRTLPWDHSPGGLLAAEAGMRVARVDGSPYAPGDGRHGLLAARPDVWDEVAAEINAAWDE